MILIVGLGNPGRKYTKTRHNIGSRIIDALKKEISDEKVILFKPDTFMNNSGKAVREEINYYKIPVENLIVIHDDIDLSFGIIRVSKNVSSAGHKGVQSIIDELGTQDFTRVRIGIKPKEKPAASFASRRARQNENLLAGFVLEKFPKQEEKQLKEIIKKAVSELKQLL
jgi:PTH1 family peptidyl-tRNA hydrolase